MSSEKTNKVATYVLGGFGAAALLALILWATGVLHTPDKDSTTPGLENVLGNSADQ